MLEHVVTVSRRSWSRMTWKPAPVLYTIAKAILYSLDSEWILGPPTTLRCVVVHSDVLMLYVPKRSYRA